MGRDLAYLLPGFFISLASFVVLVALFSLAVSTLVVWIGLPLLVACLACAKGFARLDRAALRRWAGTILPVHYWPGQKYTVGGMFRSLGDPQLWKDLLHGAVVAFVVRTATFSIAISVMAAALGGITQWLWGRLLPSDNQGLASLLHLDATLGVDAATAEAWLGLAYGVGLLFLTPPLLHALAVTDAAIVRALLTNETASLRARSEELLGRRNQVVSAGATTLRKIERDLHDGPQQRMIRLQMDLEAAKRRMATDPEGARTLMDGALEQGREALAELRALSRGIAPPILADRGLHAALTSLAGRAAVPVQFASNLPEGARLPENAENAAYFVASEALANVSKHSGATAAGLALECAPGLLTLVVRDDGRGGAHVGKGHGLLGLVDRLAGVDGALQLDSPEGGPTVLTASIPLPA